jgi:5'-nucleotidase surE
VWNIVAQLVQNPPGTPILWNVNIPAVAPQDLRGHKIARLGRRHHTQSIVHATNPRGEDIYWIGAVGAVADNEQDTDFATCESGYVSITPLQIDLTAYSQMQALDEYWQGLTFE